MKIPGVYTPEKAYILDGHSFFMVQSRPFYVLSQPPTDFAPEKFKKLIMQKVLEAIKAVHATGQSSIILSPESIRVFTDTAVIEIELAGSVGIGFNKNMEITDLYHFLRLQIWFLFDCWIDFTDADDFWYQLDALNLPIKESLFNFMCELVNEVNPIKAKKIVDHLWFKPLGWTRFYEDRLTPLTDFPLLTSIEPKTMRPSIQTTDSPVNLKGDKLPSPVNALFKDPAPDAKPKKKKGCLRGLVSTLKKIVKKLFK
jgi:hypothetical protein